MTDDLVSISIVWFVLNFYFYFYPKTNEHLDFLFRIDEYLAKKSPLNSTSSNRIIQNDRYFRFHRITCRFASPFFLYTGPNLNPRFRCHLKGGSDPVKSMSISYTVAGFCGSDSIGEVSAAVLCDSICAEHRLLWNSRPGLRGWVNPRCVPANLLPKKGCTFLGKPRNLLIKYTTPDPSCL